MTAAPLPDDRALLRRHVAGDPDAFGELVRRHRDRLWAVALRTLGDREEAADALQDALVAAYRRAGTYRGDAAVTTWLHRIVVNACLDRMRRTRPTATLDESVLQWPGVDEGADRDVALDVAAALRRIAPEQRVAIVLVDVVGHSVDEAAAILGVPPGTVKSRCARGRARLAGLLAHLRPGGNAGPPRHVPSAGDRPAQRQEEGSR